MLISVSPPWLFVIRGTHNSWPQETAWQLKEVINVGKKRKSEYFQPAWMAAYGICHRQVIVIWPYKTRGRRYLWTPRVREGPCQTNMLTTSHINFCASSLNAKLLWKAASGVASGHLSHDRQHTIFNEVVWRLARPCWSAWLVLQYSIFLKSLYARLSKILVEYEKMQFSGDDRTMKQVTMTVWNSWMGGTFNLGLQINFSKAITSLRHSTETYHLITMVASSSASPRTCFIPNHHSVLASCCTFHSLKTALSHLPNQLNILCRRCYISMPWD